MVQQRLKEATLQAQAQQIQTALPILLAAQSLTNHHHHPQQQQQQGQLISTYQSTLPPNIANPGTKFNNHPLVKFPIIYPTMSSPLSSNMMMPTNRPSVTANRPRHRLGSHVNPLCSTSALPTYQQVQEIERGISLDEAIHLKNKNVDDVLKEVETKVKSKIILNMTKF